MDEQVAEAPADRRMAAFITSIAVLAGCLAAYKVNPLASLMIVTMCLPVIFDLGYAVVESPPVRRPRLQIVMAAVTGGLAGLVAGTIADDQVARAMAQEAHAAAIGCQAKVFGDCGLGMLGVEVVAVIGIPILVVLTSIVLPICRVRLGFLVGLLGGAFAVLIALPVTAAIPLSPGWYWLAYTAIGAAGFAVAAIAWRRTLSLFVRSIAVALPMLAVSVYPLV